MLCVVVLYSTGLCCVLWGCVVFCGVVLRYRSDEQLLRPDQDLPGAERTRRHRPAEAECDTASRS